MQPSQTGVPSLKEPQRKREDCQRQYDNNFVDGKRKLQNDLKITEEAKEFGEKYMKILQEKEGILRNVFYIEIHKEILKGERVHAMKDRKKQLLDQLNQARKPDCDSIEKLYKDYCNQEKHLKKRSDDLEQLWKIIAVKRRITKSPKNYSKNHSKNSKMRIWLVPVVEVVRYRSGINQNIEFYSLGMILINSHLAQIDPKREKPAKKDLDRAMMYFYETKTPEEAYEEEKRIIRRNDRQKGENGEAQVDYNLKFLQGEGYRVISKEFSKKEKAECIKVHNSGLDIKAEYDHIIVGKPGVFVIETKKWKAGINLSSEDDGKRKKEKGVQKRNDYMDHDPVDMIGQVSRQVSLLHSILKTEIPITGIICSAYPNAPIKVGEDCPFEVVKVGMLNETIKKYAQEKNRRMLSNDEIEECVRQIEDHRYRD